MLQLLDNAVIDAPTEKGNYGSLVIKIALYFRARVHRRNIR
jgi:hypothetical protein